MGMSSSVKCKKGVLHFHNKAALLTDLEHRLDKPAFTMNTWMLLEINAVGNKFCLWNGDSGQSLSEHVVLAVKMSLKTAYCVYTRVITWYK